MLRFSACLLARGFSSAHSGPCALRCLGSRGAEAPPAAPGGASASAGGWWGRIKTAMFPVAAAAGDAAASSSGKQAPTSLMSPAALQRLQRVREAEERQQNLASSADVFTPLSRDAELFSGYMFKAGIFMISIPLAGFFVSKVLLVALCIKGLRSGSAPVIKLSLTRIQSFIFNDYLANRFEQDDGVVMLVSLLGHQDVLSNPDVLAECLATITHLMKFEETRTALLLGCVTDRLQRALERGWIAKDLVEDAKRVQKALEDCQQKKMEAAFGRVAGASS